MGQGRQPQDEDGADDGTGPTTGQDRMEGGMGSTMGPTTTGRGGDQARNDDSKDRDGDEDHHR
jgi:hypothetical protein